MPSKRLHGFGYGTARDRPDSRDHKYEPSLRRNLPKAVDLRRIMPPVYNQRHLNSCSANAIAAALWFEERHRHGNPRHSSPSRLFIYYNERAIEGIIAHNEPVSLRDGYKTVARQGVCSERIWPYDVLRFRRQPGKHCYRQAEEHRAVHYARLERSLDHMRATIASGQPFTAGFSVHNSFKSRLVRKTGVVPLPARRRDPYLGGHAMVVIGYLDDSHHFIVRNSWGPRWGDHGYCYIPYEYLLDPDLAWDFWMVRKTT